MRGYIDVIYTHKLVRSNREQRYVVTSARAVTLINLNDPGLVLILRDVAIIADSIPLCFGFSEAFMLYNGILPLR